MWVIALSAMLVAAPGPEATKVLVSVSGKVSTAEDPVTCRKYTVTGSLVRKVKECRTASEWRKVTDAAQATSRKMMIDNMGKPPGS